MRIFRNTPSTQWAKTEQYLAELDGLAVVNANLDDFRINLGLDFVHDLHGLDDAEDGLLVELIADLDEDGAVGRGAR